MAQRRAQQAAEKALKALLVVTCGDVVRTRALTILLQELDEAGVEPESTVLDVAKLLDKLYAPTRYPDALGRVDPTVVFTEREAAHAARSAESVVSYVRAAIAGFERERADDVRVQERQ